MEQIEAMEENELTILQIMPALPGWGAVGTREEPEKGESEFYRAGRLLGFGGGK